MSEERLKGPEAGGVLLEWRRRLFYSIFTAFLLLITVPFIVSTVTSVREANWFLFVLHTGGFLSVLGIVAVRRVPYRIASFVGVFSMLAVGVVAVFRFGPIGSGRIWLFAFSVLATLLYGLRGGIVTTLLNTGILIGTGFLLGQGDLPWVRNPDATLRMWVITTITYVFLNGVVVVAMAVLVNALEKRLVREQDLRRRIVRTGEELEESREKLYQAVQGSAVPTFLIDAEHRITHWNDACAGLTGRSADSMVGTSNQWMVFGEEKQPVPADIVIMNGIPKNSPFQSLVLSPLIPGALDGEVKARPGGEEKIFHCTAAPLRDRSGEVTGAIQTIMDMTDRKKVEAQLQHSQRLDAVGRLAGGVAHDFNNMLGVIIGHAELMQQRSSLNHEDAGSLEEIRDAAVRSAALTKQLLVFARKQDIEPEPLDLNEVITSMSRMLKRLLGEDISLVIRKGGSLPRVMCDRSQVDQILANLCVNARDAINGVGNITVETSTAVLDRDYCRTVPSAIPGDYVLLSVTDDGEGMDRETMERAFEPFFTTKDVDRGTGLGLSTVHGIIRQNGGHIAVYSEPGVGSTFKVFIPAFTGQVSDSVVTPVTEPEKGRGERVLLVEDEESVRNLIIVMLQRFDYSVTAAATPAEALEIVNEQGFQPDLLVTDVIMPGMNGRDLAERARETVPGLKVLFVSGYTADVVAGRGMLEEGSAFLSKPFTSRELVRTVGKVLGK